MNRRGFLGAILAAGAAPVIARAGVLMPVRQIIVPPGLILWGDGIHDDSPALQALIDGKPVQRRDGSRFERRADGSIYLEAGAFALGATLIMPSGCVVRDCDFRSIKPLSTMFRFSNISVDGRA